MTEMAEVEGRGDETGPKQWEWILEALREMKQGWRVQPTAPI